MKAAEKIQYILYYLYYYLLFIFIIYIYYLYYYFNYYYLDYFIFRLFKIENLTSAMSMAVRDRKLIQRGLSEVAPEVDSEGFVGDGRGCKKNTIYFILLFILLFIFINII